MDIIPYICFMNKEEEQDILNRLKDYLRGIEKDKEQSDNAKKLYEKLTEVKSQGCDSPDMTETFFREDIKYMPAESLDGCIIKAKPALLKAGSSRESIKGLFESDPSVDFMLKLKDLISRSELEDEELVVLLESALNQVKTKINENKKTENPASTDSNDELYFRV